MTQTVHSPDGTYIAYDRSGDGPPLIIIGGAFNTRHTAAALTPLLEPHFSVFQYDRRGRGDSTEVGPWTVQREIEDLGLLIEAAGGEAFVYGHSSGAVIGLEAAAAGLPITKLAAYEPPYTRNANGSGAIDGWGDSIQAALDAGDDQGAAVRFLTGSGVDEASVAGMQQLPWWPSMVVLAHTLPYDVALLGNGSVPVERFRDIRVPTLLLYGGDSPAWAGNATAAAETAIPNASRMVVEGQDHNTDAAVIAPLLVEYFSGD
ncbi:alpha/beta hydrolase [Salinibacterium sp. ZJ454]|uniref:alpha/beta fold hydrolase n=1 Tax=Salinibacterium sp. ZJ454 TaxID=2708339 RepID=UPI001420BB1D|nr:alpha/beta hydrolase [Salinibacterium sp. ZJ454]